MNQLKKITRKLEDNDIDYWLDSGTLLGTTREGKLLSTDLDIDISIRQGQEIDKLIKEISTSRYRLVKYVYNGVTYNYKLYPKNQYQRAIDIKIFRPDSNCYWCPAGIANPFKYTTSKRELVFNMAKIVPYAVWKIIFDGIGLDDGLVSKGDVTQRKIDQLPLSLFYLIGTWVIPKEYYESFINTSYGRVPKDRERYLNFRYGDWKTPTEDWSYWHDDGGIIHYKPEQLHLLGD